MNIAGLTPTERRVFDRLLLGLSNKEIGAALGTSDGTVSRHVIAILAKLGLRPA